MTNEKYRKTVNSPKEKNNCWLSIKTEPGKTNRNALSLSIKTELVNTDKKASALPIKTEPGIINEKSDKTPAPTLPIKTEPNEKPDSKKPVLKNTANKRSADQLSSEKQGKNKKLKKIWSNIKSGQETNTVYLETKVENQEPKNEIEFDSFKERDKKYVFQKMKQKTEVDGRQTAASGIDLKIFPPTRNNAKKRLKYLRMKLRCIESLEEKAKAGKLILNFQQTVKVSRKKEVQNLIKAIQCTL